MKSVKAAKDTPTRPRSYSASTVEQGTDIGDSKGLILESVESHVEEVALLKEQMTKLEADKKGLESKLADVVTASKDGKEKADLLSAEKKARQYV